MDWLQNLPAALDLLFHTHLCQTILLPPYHSVLTDPINFSTFSIFSPPPLFHLPLSQLQLLVQALVLSRLDSLLAGLPASAICPLQIIQNSAARLVFSLPCFSHTTPLLRSLHWPPIAACIQFKTLVLAYHCLDLSAPSYLQTILSPYTPPHPLRSSTTGRLTVPPLRSHHCLSVMERPTHRYQHCSVPDHLPERDTCSDSICKPHNSRLYGTQLYQYKKDRKLSDKAATASLPDQCSDKAFQHTLLN
ncbi:UNVERIFIED_CONTAM: hypothetical protein FKN15_022655 [Acipenser sinensis]